MYCRLGSAGVGLLCVVGGGGNGGGRRRRGGGGVVQRYIGAQEYGAALFVRVSWVEKGSRLFVVLFREPRFPLFRMFFVLFSVCVICKWSSTSGLKRRTCGNPVESLRVADPCVP